MGAVMISSKEKPGAANTGQSEKTLSNHNSTTMSGKIKNSFNSKACLQHLRSILEIAKNTDGKIILASYGQDPATGVNLNPKVKHFDTRDDAKKVLQIIKNWVQEQHRNIYIPLCLMRSDLPTGKKGGLDDIVSVFGICADFDDKNAGEYKNRLPLEPDTVLETSQGRYQAMFLFDSPIPNDRARNIAANLHEYSKCDHGTKDTAHVWRIPGTFNYPNKKKVTEGRSSDPQIVKIIKEPECFTTNPDKLEAKLQAWKDHQEINQAKIPSKTHVNTDQQIFQWDGNIDSLPLKQGTKNKIIYGLPEGERSEAIMTVLNGLVYSNLSDSEILSVFQSYAIGEKYREKKNPEKWLRPQIDKARARVNDRAVAKNHPISKKKFPHSDNKEWDLARSQFPKIHFPWEVLPESLSNSLKQLARSCSTSPTHLPGIAFCILAAVLGRHIDVMVKSSWSEPLIFWILSLLPSGEGKTPAQNALSIPIYEEQERIDKLHKQELEKWALLPPDEQKQKPKPESPGGIFTSDMTIEGLLKDQRPCGGCLVVNDEASAFFDNQNQYKSGKGTDRQSWLKLYDGNSARIVRASGSVFLKGARVSIAGGTQPEVFFRVFKSDDKNQGDIFLVDGTLFRFQMTWEGEKFFPMTLESWNDFSKDVWSRLIENAFRFCKEHEQENEDEIKTQMLWFEKDALDFFIDWANDLKSKKPLLPLQVRGFISKLIGWSARFAGIISCIESFIDGTRVNQKITLEALNKGIRVAEFYIAHNVDVMASIAKSDYIVKQTYTDQEIHLAETLQELKSDIDNGRLAVGFIWESYNKKCSSEIKFKTPHAFGGLLRSCDLDVTGGKHNANGKRAVNCLQWNKNTDSFIENCLLCLHSLQKQSEQGFQHADFKKSMSAKSAINNGDDESMQTMQTLNNQSLQVENTVNKDYADKADNADNFLGKDLKSDEVVI
jgi:hypothetical protein